MKNEYIYIYIIVCILCETGEVLTGFWWGDLWERDYSDDLGVDGRIILK
jgi:hypothetical protein